MFTVGSRPRCVFVREDVITNVRGWSDESELDRIFYSLRLFFATQANENRRDRRHVGRYSRG